MPISALNNSVIGIDAAYYLESTPKERLLSAMGGFPLGLEPILIRDLHDLQSVGLKPHFVFNGLDDGVSDDPFGPSLAAAKANAAAYETYDGKSAIQAKELFGTSDSPPPAALLGFLKRLLHKLRIPFTVAPFNALAQLAYFEKHPSQFIDAIYGPSELFFYDVDKLITKFKLAYRLHEDPRKGVVKQSSHFIPEHSEFEWIDRRACLEELGRIPPDLFTDSLLLAGSRTLGPFPAIKNFEKGYTIREVTNLVASYGRSVANLCGHYPDDKHIPRSVYLNYLDQYKRVLTGIRHHIVITMEGDIEPLDKVNAPHDLHDCVGQRLPEELNMYLSRGLIQPRVLNWLASGTVLMLAPYDGGDSQVYQHLVRVQLDPLRKQAIGLLADSTHRYWQKKEMTTKYWFDPTHEVNFNIKDLLPSPKDSLASWNVRGNVLSERQQVFNLLETREEICANAVWRFLQLRGYVDQQHQLTSWGKVLNSMLSFMGYSLERERAALLAVELLRFDLLKADTMFASYSGAPFRGSNIDKRNCMLVSRVACLGRLIHQQKGYSGPLSRHLQAYHSMISAVQASMRDLVEMNVVTMFLEGSVERERDDWMDIALTLPFFEEDNCGLGVAVLQYLDELSVRSEPTSEATRNETKSRGPGLIKYCDFELSLQHGFQLWDAVYSAVKQAKALGEEVKELKMWEEVDQWLSPRR
ncbi:MAG: hypothetical protein LQ343_008005 [Gyalolechia ehrenbergii]|nr:MAG: hypothetical protein LQ343_008005 [Gyalolechia ehrenbergii]